MEDSYLLNLRDLKTYFSTSWGKVLAVDGVNLKIKKGETVALVGESGCGKSTLGFSITRLIPPSGSFEGGNIFFKNRDILQLSNSEMRKIRGREISMIFQDPMTYLDPIMRVGRQISQAYSVHKGGKKKEAKERAIELLKTVELPEPEKIYLKYSFELSGGMRQRVVIAMALACDPSLIIADEPTTALDVTIQQQILDLLKRLKERLGLSILLITHDLGIAADIADRIYVMYAGKIVETADVFTIFKNPEHPYTQGLLKSAFSIDEFKKQLFYITGSVPDLINPPSGCRFHPRCPHAKEVCSQEAPPVIQTEADHFVSCWLYSDGDYVV